MTENKPQTREITIVTGSVPVSVVQAPKPIEKPKYAYIIKDNIGGEIGIKATYVGWWNDLGKVKEMITALKRGYSQRRAALRIGISPDQLTYFIEVHPEFSSKIADFQEALPMKLIDQINVAVDRGDMQTVRWAAERKIPDEYGTKEKAPLIIIPINMREVRKRYEREAIESNNEAAGA